MLQSWRPIRARLQVRKATKAVTLAKMVQEHYFLLLG